MNYSNLMEAVNARIKANGRREITGDILNDVLRAMVASLGAGYQVGGTLRPDDKPKVEDQRVAFLAVEPGMYLYAGGFEVTELSLITYGAEWYMYPLGVPFGTQIAEDIAAAVEVEKTRAIAAEKALNDAIATEARERATADSALDSAIKAETKRATDAEGVLTKAVEAEKARAQAAEGANASAITAEADARAKADTALQGNITAEATAREAADDALAAKITAEETARKAADATLQSNIDTKVSKDDENWLEKFMPRITLNYDSTVKSVTVGDNVAADYSTIRTRLSHYGGVVSGSPEHPGYPGYPAQGRVVQVYDDVNNNQDSLFVTAIFNYAQTFSRTFANSIYEIILNYNSEGEFVSGTYKVKPISEVFEISLSSHDGSWYYIDRTYDAFLKMDEDYGINGTLPLIILNDAWTRANFILTRYDNAYFSAERTFQLSFISIRDKQLIGYYIFVEKTKTTITPFEFQAQTKEEVESAAKRLNELENSVTRVQDNFQGLAEYLQPIIEDLQTGKQDVIPDLDMIRSQAKNGQTAFGWGDHAKAGYAKPFVITLTKGSSVENPLVVDKTYEEVATALSANSLILLKGAIDGATEIYQLAWADDYPGQGIVLLFSYFDGDSSSCHSVRLTFSVQGDVDVKTRGDKFATDAQVKAKQDTLVSGTNIKTINGESVLGSGDLKVSGGLPTIQAGTGTNSEVFNGIAPASASGDHSHAEGVSTTASGVLGAHAEGNSTNASGQSSHAEGFGNEAIGDFSHAEGQETTANGENSHAEGYQTTSVRQGSHAEGQNNVPDGAAIHQVGVGEEDAPKDAHRITYDGKHYILGIGGFDGTKATEDLNGEKDLATVINEMTPVILNYNGLGGNNEPIFVGEDGTALTRAQICALLNGVNASRVVLKNKASAAMQTSLAKFLQCDVNAFVIGFEGASAAGQIFDILYSWDATAAKVLRAELLYNPTA